MKKNTLIALVVVSILPLQGCSYFANNKPATSGNAGVINSEQARVNALTIETNAAEQNLDISACKKIADENLKDQCLINTSLMLATIKVDAKYCENITDELTIQECRDKVSALKKAGVQPEK